MLNVFIHIDGTSSAPLCQLGCREVYRWANGNCVNMEGTQCNNFGCTCSVKYPISHKANDIETATFYKTIRQTIDVRLYNT